MITPATKFFYVASPYRKYGAGIEMAARHAAQLCAELVDRGVEVYSPIVLSHEYARYSKIDPMDERWLVIGRPIMAAACGIIVLKMAGWDMSSGVAGEMDWFKQHKRPIYLLDVPLPDLLHGDLRCR
jgi:hypothetical protein